MEQKCTLGLSGQGPARGELEWANQISAGSIQSMDADTVIWEGGGGDGGTFAFSFRASGKAPRVGDSHDRRPLESGV